MKELSSTNDLEESESTGLINTHLKLKPYKIFSKSGNNKIGEKRAIKAHQSDGFSNVPPQPFVIVIMLKIPVWHKSFTSRSAPDK